MEDKPKGTGSRQDPDRRGSENWKETGRELEGAGSFAATAKRRNSAANGQQGEGKSKDQQDVDRPRFGTRKHDAH